MGFTSRYLYSFLVLLFGGSAITTFELLVGQLFTSFYNRAFYFSTTVQSITLPGLISYNSGEFSYAGYFKVDYLIYIFYLITFLDFIFPFVASLLISTCRKTGFYSGISFVLFLSFALLMFCSRLFEIMALQLFNEKKKISLASGYFGKMKTLYSIYSIY